MVRVWRDVAVETAILGEAWGWAGGGECLAGRQEPWILVSCVTQKACVPWAGGAASLGLLINNEASLVWQSWEFSPLWIVETQRGAQEQEGRGGAPPPPKAL